MSTVTVNEYSLHTQNSHHVRMTKVTGCVYLSKNFKGVADTAEPYYELMYMPFDADAPKPSFMASVKTPNIIEQGFVLYYAHQCPFTVKYALSILPYMANEYTRPI